MPGALVWERHWRWVEEWGQPGEHCQVLDQELELPDPVEHREEPGVVSPVAYWGTSLLVASTRMVCLLAAVVAVANPGMWVASGSTVAAESVDGADRAVADSVDID